MLMRPIWGPGLESHGIFLRPRRANWLCEEDQNRGSALAVLEGSYLEAVGVVRQGSGQVTAQSSFRLIREEGVMKAAGGD